MKDLPVLVPIMIKNINPEGSSLPANFTLVNDTVFFTARDTYSGLALWKTDCTESGTILVKSIHNPYIMNAQIRDFIDVNGTLFFVAVDKEKIGMDLWRSDGTEAGTFKIKNFISEGIHHRTTNVNQLTNVKGTLYFVADDGTHGRELWKSDGTEAGTVMVKDINPTMDPYYKGANPSLLINLDGTLFFSATDGVHGIELWKIDENGQAVMVKDINPKGNSIYYLHDPGLKDINGTLYFTADDGVHGYELWKSDGTTDGTVMIKDIRTGVRNRYGEYIEKDSTPKGFIYFNGAMYFWAPNGLWKTDGTESGTVLVKGNTPWSTSFIIVNGTLFFSANKNKDYELWKMDQHEEPVKVKDINPSGSSVPQLLTNVDGTLYFVANDGTHGRELWKSDGTEAGTVMVKNVNQSNKKLNGNYYNFINLNGILYFTHGTELYGINLWKSDGTEEGTIMIEGINTTGLKTFVGNLANINGTLFFTADDGKHGYELWKLAPLPSTLAYIPNQNVNSVSVINLSAEKFGQTEVSIPVGDSPRVVAVNPDFSRVYIGNSESQSISVIDSYTNTVAHTLDVEGRPLAVALSPDNQKIVVTTNDLATGQNPKVRIYDTATYAALATFPVGFDPDGIAFAPDGTIYVPSHDASSNAQVHVFKVNATTGQYEAQTALPITAQVRPEGIIYLGEGADAKLYIAAGLSGGAGSVIVLPLSNPNSQSSLPLANTPKGMVLSPDGSKIYAVESNGDVRILDTSKDELSATIIDSLSSNPGGVSITHDGATLLITNPNSDEVTKIDLLTNAWGGRIDVGSDPAGWGNFIAGPVQRPATYVPHTEVRAYVPIFEDVRLHSLGNEILAVVDTQAEVVKTYTHATAKNTGGDTVGMAQSEVSPDGKQVMLSFLNSSTLAMVNTETNRVEKTYEMLGEVLDMEFKPDGSQLYVATNSDLKIEILDFASGDKHSTGVTFTNQLRSLVASQNGKKLYAIQDVPTDAGLVMVDIPTQTSKTHVATGESVLDVVFHPTADRAYFSTNNGSIKTMNTATDTEVAGGEITGLGPIGDIAIHPDGNTLYYINTDDKRLYSIDISSKATTEIAKVRASTCMQISADGKTMYVLAMGTSDFLVVDLTATPPVVPRIIDLGGHIKGCGCFVRG